MLVERRQDVKNESAHFPSDEVEIGAGGSSTQKTELTLYDSNTKQPNHRATPDCLGI